MDCIDRLPVVDFAQTGVNAPSTLVLSEVEVRLMDSIFFFSVKEISFVKIPDGKS